MGIEASCFNAFTSAQRIATCLHSDNTCPRVFQQNRLSTTMCIRADAEFKNPLVLWVSAATDHRETFYLADPVPLVLLHMLAGIGDTAKALG